uniref:Uncharacterized protein n=1 Tax=Saccharolobus islandicus TaxID=43080 RepID=Q0ZNR5_SACIS|nr:hypothetical protein [Sulfolobus islandicus]ABE99650.1 hypothetical protein [Sulfolobus islandicus]
MIIVNNIGELVDTETGEVISDEYRYTFERYDNLAPVQLSRIDNSNEKKALQFLKYSNRRDHELNMMIEILVKRIEDEKIKQYFLLLAENARKYGKPGIIAAYAIANYAYGISVRTKKIREEFLVGDFEYRQIRKILQEKIKKSVNDIDRLVLEKLKEYDNFEDLKKRYFELKEKGVFAGKNVSARIEILLGIKKKNASKKHSKNNEKVIEVIDEKGHIVCPKCGKIGYVVMREKKGHMYYYVQHYEKYSYIEHYLGKNIRLQKRVYFQKIPWVT